ncbi:MAG: YfiR family protein [Planctomycetota bacterium]
MRASLALAPLLTSSLREAGPPAPGAAPQGATQQANEQDPAAEARAAVLRAMVVLKIAPYLKRDAGQAGDDKTPYRIAVVGDDATVAAIKRHLPGKEVGKRQVEIVALSEQDATRPNRDRLFDAMFLAHDLDAKALASIVAAHEKLPTVLISERAGFSRAGGSVQLFVEDNGLRFEVNQDALKKQGVRASHQLLKLSRKGPEK